MPSRIVLDTNVIVAALFNPRSAAARILESVREGRLHLVWNDATRREVVIILSRIPPLRNHPIETIFHPEHRFDAPTHPESFPTIPDPEDRKFAALAHAANAALITNDRHLLHTRNLTVLTPTQFTRHPP